MRIQFRICGNPPLTLASTADGIMGLLDSLSDEADIPDDRH